VAVSALAGAASANVAAIALTTGPDPILGAIDRYWAAVRRRRVTEMETWDYGGHPEFAHLPKDHPFWQEKEDGKPYHGAWKHTAPPPPVGLSFLWTTSEARDSIAVGH
jgi:hypothetical protein